MQNIFVTDETFDKNLANSYELSLQLCSNRFSYCILDPLRNKFIVFYNHPIKNDLPFDMYLDEIDQFIKKEEILHLDYKTKRVQIVSRKSILIPADLFDKNNLKTFLNFNTPIDELEEIHYNFLEKYNIYNVFAIHSEITNIISRKLNSVKFYHQSTSLIKSALDTNRSIFPEVYMVIYSDFIEISVLKQGKILLYNTFHKETEDDILFHVMNCYNQLNIDTYLTPIIISGETNNIEILFSDYFKNVRIDKPLSKYIFSYTFKPIDEKLVVNLFNLSNCE